MQEQNNFKYIFKGEEVSKEQFIKLAKESFKWFSDNTIQAVDFDSVSKFFSGDYKSDNEIAKHFKGVLDSQSDNYFMSDHFSKVNKEQKVIEDWNKKEFYITPPTKENLEKMCDSFEQRVKNDSDKCGDINYIVPECKSKFGKKETDGKLNYELDWEFIQQMAERMSQNKGKYEPYNWRKLMDVEKLKQSLFRHIIEIMKGNYSDDGREYGHLESLADNAMMINYQLKNNSK